MWRGWGWETNTEKHGRECATSASNGCPSSQHPKRASHRACHWAWLAGRALSARPLATPSARRRHHVHLSSLVVSHLSASPPEVYFFIMSSTLFAGVPLAAFLSFFFCSSSSRSFLLFPVMVSLILSLTLSLTLWIIW